jgi:hypothetical protein
MFRVYDYVHHVLKIKWNAQALLNLNIYIHHFSSCWYEQKTAAISGQYSLCLVVQVLWVDSNKHLTADDSAVTWAVTYTAFCDKLKDHKSADGMLFSSY